MNSSLIIVLRGRLTFDWFLEKMYGKIVLSALLNHGCWARPDYCSCNSCREAPCHLCWVIGRDDFWRQISVLVAIGASYLGYKATHLCGTGELIQRTGVAAWGWIEPVGTNSCFLVAYSSALAVELIRSSDCIDIVVCCSLRANWRLVDDVGGRWSETVFKLPEWRNVFFEKTWICLSVCGLLKKWCCN